MIKFRLPPFTLGTAIVLVLCLVKLLSPHFEDPDFYWHIKTGEYLLSAWPPGRADVFSFPNAGNAWVLSEWGAQVVLYLTFNAFGYTGAAWFTALLCAACLGQVYRCCLLLGCREALAATMTLLCSVFLLDAAPRPHLFTFLLFSVVLTILLEFKYQGRNEKLWRLPVVMALWANLHGGYFIGLVLMAAFAAAEWWGYGWRGADALNKHKLTRLTRYVLLALLATLLNPEFIRYWWYPVEAILMSGDAQVINEWQSPSFHAPITQYFLVLVAGFATMLIYSRRRPDATEFAVPALFIAAALVSVRNLPLAAMAMVPFLGRFLSAWVAAPQAGPLYQLLQKMTHTVPANKQGGEVEAPLLNVLLVAVVGLTVWFVYPEQQKRVQAVVEKYMPVKAADFLVREHIQGRMFNAYQYGGYLIFRLYPQQQVFIYGRTDIFRPGFLAEHDAIYQARANWKTYFDRYQFDYVVCETNAAVRQVLLAARTFTLVYDDGRHSVLVRNAPQFAQLIARYGKTA